MQRVTPYLRYLAIPREYALTNDLRWSATGDAIETVDGETFLLTPVLPPFLEGFAAHRSLIHFAYMLDLLRLLGYHGGTWNSEPESPCEMIRAAHRAGGRSLRNAGAFFAALCRNIAPAWLSGGSGLALAKWLATRPVYPTMSDWKNAEPPPLDATSFRTHILTELKPYSKDEVYHWLRFGQPSLKEEGDRLAGEILAAKPKSPRGTLEELLRKRPRLAGALPLVGTLIGALSLPPRRRTPPELPIGGFSDVTTRGDPSHLLPSQFALDADEFIRRFAEKELLFFRREEPHRRTREQMTLLVDQGVRTWGPVRLALSAAVLAFHSLAVKRAIPFAIRFGSKPTERIDPSICDGERLADRLEACDLSAVPIGLLDAENTIEPEEADIVLLTHPRTLKEADVSRYATAIPPCKRLFALTVDDEGSGEFSQMRGGQVVAISRFRVDFSSKVPEPIGGSRDDALWSGEVEPIPFPFSIGPIKKIVALGFDADTTHLLIATQRGYLHLYRLMDGRRETPPRAMLNGIVLVNVEAIVGVRGGFVVGGVVNNLIVAAHYDLDHRSVKVHALGAPGGGLKRWHAFPEIHSIAVRQIAICRGLDLNSGAMYAEPEQPPVVNARAHQAYLQALLREFPAPFIPVQLSQFGQTPIPMPKPYLEHDRETGRITVHSDGGSKSLLPHVDGAVLFFGDVIQFAQTAGNSLAIRIVRTTNTGLSTDWYLFDLDEAASLREIPVVNKDNDLNLLSPDGCYFARYWGHGQIIVDRLGPTAPGLTTAPSRIHNRLSLQLGRDHLRIVIGNKMHALSWREGPLNRDYRRVRKDDTLDYDVVFDRRGVHPFFAYDAERFPAFASKNVDAIVDATGQIVIFDPHRNRVACIFFVWRDELAAWLPDGTRYGPSQLSGGPAWPDALEKIGEALRAAGS